MKLVLSLVILIAISINLKSQDGYNFHIDTLTFGLYQRGEWDALYKSVNKAQKNDVSFYYLYLRGAFASYYTSRYSNAVELFKKAGKIQLADKVVRHYHYLSALYANMPLETKQAYKNLPHKLKSQYPDPESKKIFESIAIESGFNTNSSFDELSNSNIQGGSNNIGEQTLLKTTKFTSVFISHVFSPRVKIQHSFYKINLNREQRFQMGPIINEKLPVLTSQSQYFINPVFIVNDIWTISPAYTTMSIIIEEYKPNNNNTPSQFSANKETTTSTSQVVLLSLYANKKRTSWEFNYNQLISSDESRWQTGVNLTLYPNLKKTFYLTGGVHALQNSTNSSSGNNLITKGKIGGQIGEIWIEANISSGNMQNFVDANGLLVFNTRENVKQISGLNFSLPLKKDKLWFAFYYGKIDYESTYTYLDNNFNLIEEKYEHDNHSFTGKFSFYF